MLEVDDILPSPLTPLVLQPPVPEPVCEMQTPALFTMAQSSPQPQSVDTVTFARVNPLPSPATFSSSGELRLYIDSDGNLPSNLGPPSSSQELLLQGNQPPPPTSSTAPIHNETVTHSSQSTSSFLGGRSGKIWSVHTRYSRPQLGRFRQDSWTTTTLTAIGLSTTRFPVTPTTSTTRILTAVRACNPPLWLSSRSYNHRTSNLLPPITIRAPTLHHADALVQRSTKSTLLVPHNFLPASHQLDMVRAHHEAHSPHHPGEKLTLLRRHKASPTALMGQISGFTIHKPPWNQHPPRNSCPRKDKLLF